MYKDTWVKFWIINPVKKFMKYSIENIKFSLKYWKCEKCDKIYSPRLKKYEIEIKSDFSYFVSNYKACKNCFDKHNNQHS